MKKYSYLTFKTIVPSLLLIALIVFGCAYFFGGLKATYENFDNLIWDMTDFEDMNLRTTFNNAKLVAHNDKYAMVLDENTTIVTVYKKGSAWNENAPVASGTVTKMYSSALPGGTSDEKSNLLLTYYNLNGKTTTLNTYDKSVQYENVTTGTTERHYKIRYNAGSNTVDILYTVGNFAPYIFPKQYNYDALMDRMLGNTFIMYQESSFRDTDLVDVVDEEGNKVPLKKYNGSEYSDVDQGVLLKIKTISSFSNDVALYVLQNDLGTISHTDASGKKFDKNSEADIEYIKNVKKGTWTFTDLYDEDGQLKWVLGVNYNCSDSPIEMNVFMPYPKLYEMFKFYTITAVDSSTDPAKLVAFGFPSGIMDLNNKRSLYSDVYLRLPQVVTLPMKGILFRSLYVGSYETDEEGIKTFAENRYYISSTSGTAQDGYPLYFDYNDDGVITEDEYFQYGGFPLRDDQGNYMYSYNEDGSIKRALQDSISVEEAEEQNTKYNNPDSSGTVGFELALRFELTGDCMNVTVIHNSIREGVGSKNKDSKIEYYFKHDMLLGDIELCKYMTTSTSKTEEGQIILPDGSGSIISFNSNKEAQYASKYQEKRIYGMSGGNVFVTGGMNEQLLFGMYGYIEQTSKKGVIAIVDKGAAQTSISASFRREDQAGGMNPYNYACFKTTLRESEEIQVTTTTKYIKTTRDIYQEDIVYKYVFLDSADTQTGQLTYVDVANRYRAYLVDKYDMQYKTDDTKTATPTITFIGAYEKKTLKVIVATNSDYSLTTFNQAKNIVDELVSNGVDSMSVSYKSWTNDVGGQPTTSNVDVAKVLGGQKALDNLTMYLKEMNFNFFPEYSVTSGYGYDFMFGALKYNSKTIAGSYSNVIDTVLSTGLEDPNGRRGSFISPIYYNSLVTKYLSNYTKLNIKGLYLSDIGNRSVFDAARKVQVYPGGGVLYQQSVLDKVSSAGNKVMLSAPFDYAISYADVATSVPVTTTLYGIVDRSIPLYQLVVSGLLDYSSKPVNYGNDYSLTWNFLKAIETGSNLEYYISAQDTNVLLDTRYSEYYNAYYANWRDSIIRLNNDLNATGIYASRLVDHKYINDNVVQVTYANGLTIIINYDTVNYYDSASGLIVKSNWYACVQRGA